MLHTLKAAKLVLNWRKRYHSSAAVRTCLDEFLDRFPLACTCPIFAAKCEPVYQRAYDSYSKTEQRA